MLANSIYQAYQKKKKDQLFLEKIKLLRPIISMNELTGNFEVTLDITRSQSIEHTVPQLLSYLDEQEVKFVIAFVEFQQILTHPEKKRRSDTKIKYTNFEKRSIYFLWQSSSFDE